MVFRKLFTVTTCACLMTGAGLIAADQPTKEQNKEQTGQHAQSKHSDQALATCIAIGNQEEIAMAKFAESKAKHQDVKEFAKMLVTDHQAFLKKLEKFAPEATRDGYLSERNDRTNDGQKTNDGQRSSNLSKKAGEVNVNVNGNETNVSADSNQHLDFVALHRELAENCIRESKEAMSKKDGLKFDECYIGTQIVKHAEMKNKLTVFERHTSGELRDVFAAGRETTEKHMKRAEEIMKKLAESNSSKQVSDARQ